MIFGAGAQLMFLFSLKLLVLALFYQLITELLTALRQGSNVSTQASKDSVPPDIASPVHPVILQRDTSASPTGAGSPTASGRVMAVASPKRLSTANLARDPRTGKGVQYYLCTVLSTIDYCCLKNTLCLKVMYNIAEKTEFTPRFLLL